MKKGLLTLYLISWIIGIQAQSCADTLGCYVKEAYPSGFSIQLSEVWESIRVPDFSSSPQVVMGCHDTTAYIIHSDFYKNLRRFTIDTSHALDSIPIENSYALSMGFYTGHLDADDVLDIVVAGIDNVSGKIKERLYRYDILGNLVWVSEEEYTNNGSATPEILCTDLNKDGVAEVVVYNKVFNAANGRLLCKFDDEVHGTPSSCIVAGDFDGDGDLELAAGNTVYEVSITNLEGTAGNQIRAQSLVIDGASLDGYTAMADIDLDGRLEVVVTVPDRSAGVQVYAYRIEGGGASLVGKASFKVDPGAVLGPPTVVDQGSDPPLIIFSTEDYLLAYAYDGAGSLGERWRYGIEEEYGNIRATAYDLNNDGYKEVIIQDEKTLQVIDLSTGAPVLVAEQQCASITLIENPIVADVDRDGDADICVLCRLERNDTRIKVFSSPDTLPGWTPSRSIWNQYNYHPPYVDDDLRVVREMQNPATYEGGRYNNFGVQSTTLDGDGMYRKRAASLYGTIDCVDYDAEQERYRVSFGVYNRADATASIGDSIVVSFYDGDPEGSGILVQTTKVAGLLDIGSVLSGQVEIQGRYLDQLFMVVNTEGKSTQAFTASDYIHVECDYTDNISQAGALPIWKEEHVTSCTDAVYVFYGDTITSTGQYIHRLQGVTGCDSVIVRLDIEVSDTIRVDIKEEACTFYDWDGSRYTTSGIYTEVYTGGNGCDSMVVLDLKISESVEEATKMSVCDSLEWNGVWYASSGAYRYEGQTIAGCDSIVTLDLEVNESYDQSMKVASCGSYDWDGEIYDSTGVYIRELKTVHGCDSIVSLDLEIKEILRSEERIQACDSYSWDGEAYTESGRYDRAYTSISGCDSIATLILEIEKSVEQEENMSVCDSLKWNGVWYASSGAYRYEGQTIAGCDSIVTLDLEVNESYDQSMKVASCGSYDWGGEIYDSTGVYIRELKTVHGCDSIVSLDLEIKEILRSEERIQACDSYSWDGEAYTESGRYDRAYTSISGCDSIATLILEIEKSVEQEEKVSVCDSLEWNGVWYASSGAYRYEGQTIAGCDSIVTLDLEVNESYDQSMKVVSCGSYDWGGEIYDSTGVYIRELKTVHGCDSIVSLDLQIGEEEHIVEYLAGCGAAYWRGQEYLENGLYYDTIHSVQQCDTIYSLDVLVYPSYEIRDTVTTSTPYIWEVTHELYKKSGEYISSYETGSGCDSIHYLKLIIKEDGISYPNILRGGAGKYFMVYPVEKVESMKIYDRWGNLVYVYEMGSPGWDGTLRDGKVSVGVYTWWAVINEDGRKVHRSGDVTVIGRRE